MNRRSFLRTGAGVVVAPWVVKAENIMRIAPVVTRGPKLGLSTMDLGSFAYMRHRPGMSGAELNAMWISYMDEQRRKDIAFYSGQRWER